MMQCSIVNTHHEFAVANRECLEIGLQPRIDHVLCDLAVWSKILVGIKGEDELTQISTRSGQDRLLDAIIHTVERLLCYLSYL